jgi:Uma2 family endonuclease
LSAGPSNNRRDREIKLKLYSRRGVDEYWIVDPQLKTIQIFQRQDAELVLTGTLAETGILITPLLDGFACRVGEIFVDVSSSSRIIEDAPPPAGP